MGQWYHVKALFDKSRKTVRIYVNDIFTLEMPYLLSTTTGIKKVWLGNYGFGTVDTTWFLDNFKITEMKDTNTLADASAIDTNVPTVPSMTSVTNATTSTLDVNWDASTDAGTDYNYLVVAFDDFGNASDPTGLAALKGYWRLEDGSGTAASDSSGNSNNGTVNGNPIWSSGRLGGDLNFDGSGDYINVTSIPISLMQNGFTWSTWLKTGNSAGTWSWLFASSTTAGAYIWFQCGKKSASGNIRFETGTFTSNTALDTTSSNVADGSWHLLTCVWDRLGSKKYIYIDGQVAAQATATVNDTSTNYGNLYIGAHAGPAEYWFGEIDEAMVFTKALSQNEISALYNRGSPASTTVTSGIKQYWLQDLNASNKVYGPFSSPTTQITGLTGGTQHCFNARSQDYADNNSAWSTSQSCGTTLSAAITLSSSSHSSEGTWYNDSTVDMLTSGTFDHIHYWVTANATETAAAIYASGTQDTDGTFTTAALASNGTWYVHAVSHNAEHGGTATDHFQVNYDGTNPTSSSISVSAWSGGITGYTSDVTPSLSISASDTGGSGLSQMAFSCTGSTWDNWMPYATAINSVNDANFYITTGAGCSTSDGNRIVYAKVKDTAGNESVTPAQTASFVLDRAAPSSNSIAVSSWTGQSTYTNDNYPPLTISSTDSGGVYQMKWSCNDSAYSSYEAYATSRNPNVDTNNWNIKPAVSANGCGTADGSRTLYAIFKDRAGNEAASANTGAFTLDQTPPVVSLSSPVNDYNYSTPDPSLTSTQSAEVNLWKCFARIGTANPPSSPSRIVSGTIESNDCTFSGYAQLSEGTYYWDANALDSAGNWSSYSSTRWFTRDNNAPPAPSNYVIENDSQLPYWDNANNSKTDFAFTAGEINETCKWNNTSVAYASMANSCTVSGLDVNCAFGNKLQTTTSHQYDTNYHACADAVGNAYSTLDINYGIDWTAPTTSDDSSATIVAPTYSVTITEADNASNAGTDITTYYCNSSNSCTPTTAINTGGTVNFTASSPGRGTQYLRYYSTDLANNTQSTVTKTININQLPVWSRFDSNVGDGNTISCLGGKNINFSTTASDPDAGQTLKFYVCSTSSATSSDCAETTYCSSTGSSTNPSCVYAQPDSNSLVTAYGIVYDSLNERVTDWNQTSYTCDSAVPTVTLSSPSNGSSSSDNTPDFVAAPSEAVSNCYLQLATDANFTSVVSGYDGIDVGTDCDYTAPSALSDGTYYWKMKATDSVGNAGNYGSAWSFTIDTAALSTSIVSIAGDTNSAYWDTANDSQTAAVISGESGMSCRWGTEDVVWSSMTNDCSISGTQATCNLGSLAQRNTSTTHYVSCKDSVGNEQTTGQNIDLTFGVDWTVPTVGTTEISSTSTATHATSPANINSGTITESISLDTTTCEYTLNGSSWVAGTWSDSSSKCVDNAVALNDGSNSINYRIRDAAGNLGTGTAITRTKDNDAPTGFSLGFGTIGTTFIVANVSGASDSGAGLHSTPYDFAETTTASSSGYQSSTDWNKASLDVNTLYTFKVRVKDALGNESAFTATQNKFTLANAPLVPSVAQTASNNTLNVTINVNSNPAGTQFAIYDLNLSKWVNADNNASGASETWKIASSWGSSNIVTGTGLAANSQHCFQAKARNGDFTETALSSQACATTLGVNAPTNLTASFADSYGLNSGKGDVSLSWEDNSQAESGNYVYRSVDGTTFINIATTAANAISYSDTNSGNGLKDNRILYYKVGAFSGSNDVNSNTAAVFVLDRTAPGTPAIDVKTYSGRNYADVNWSVVSDNNTSQAGMLYRIFRSLDGVSFSLRASQTGAVNFADLTATDTNAPSAPVAEPITNADTSSIQVSWSPSTDYGNSYYYKLEALDAQGNDANSAVDSNTVVSSIKQYWLQDLNASNQLYGPYIGTTLANIASLNIGSQHCFQAKAQDYGDNNSAWSNIVCSTTSAYVRTSSDANGFFNPASNYSWSSNWQNADANIHLTCLSGSSDFSRIVYGSSSGGGTAWNATPTSSDFYTNSSAPKVYYNSKIDYLNSTTFSLKTLQSSGDINILFDSASAVSWKQYFAEFANVFTTSLQVRYRTASDRNSLPASSWSGFMPPSSYLPSDVSSKWIEFNVRLSRNLTQNTTGTDSITLGTFSVEKLSGGTTTACSATYYRIDDNNSSAISWRVNPSPISASPINGNDTWFLYDSNVLVAGDGNRSLSYFSVSTSDWREPDQNIFVLIQKTLDAGQFACPSTIIDTPSFDLSWTAPTSSAGLYQYQIFSAYSTSSLETAISTSYSGALTTSSSTTSYNDYNALSSTYNYCGDFKCGYNETCAQDSVDCSRYGYGYACSNGCSQAYPAYADYYCYAGNEDSSKDYPSTRVGIDSNYFCPPNYVCRNGCVPSGYASNPETFVTEQQFNPYSGSSDGYKYFSLRTTDNLGNIVSKSLSCLVDSESPFVIPYNEGRNLSRTIGGFNIDFNVPAAALGTGVDANIVIDVNSSLTATDFNLLKAFTLSTRAGSLTFTSPATFKVDFNKMALPCWPSCTIADANKVALYDYNSQTGTWTKLRTIVDWDNNQMWADLNSI
ncbi:MAG: LamG domain-containing protein [Candidatus Diapherotrites archaeon]|uniref:LamG domain-containing protein n=1 Tax=Candidatus Iainarchaeum sp. TaxID=3101447 RepID=A0A8T4KXZ6_9ARCH|nr:LamG domain-containing protein [Candidatus Diapherotrites archaeon]